MGTPLRIFRVPTDNPLKVRAVRRAVARFGWPARVLRVRPPARASQPRGWRSTVRLARLRARSAGIGGVGIESGIVRMPGAGPLNVVVCAVFDGRATHVGIGPGFALPEWMARGADRRELGAVLDERTGRRGVKRRGGAVSVLSGGRVRRQELIEQSVLMALTSLRSENVGFPADPSLE